MKDGAIGAGRRVWLSAAPLPIDGVLDSVRHEGAGAVDLFLGLVRDHNEGRLVSLLEYEAYDAMALAEMERIVGEVEAALAGVRCAIAHRIGALAVGELAVVCAASAPHRAEAFTACRLLIEEVKRRVPIWKHEHGPDGVSWVGCQHPLADT
ncbi:MAG TPA: molybdenum cofactor biosynthesis protein MoaE [Polyangia bacterium]|nr:molybdenum cofactor biosynthesis protein MoaE [Polyangia bacterium]